MRALLFVLASILLSSCASMNNHSTSTIGGPASDGAQAAIPIILREAYSFDSEPSIGKITLTIAAGTYLPIGENELGLLYVGPKDCLLTEGSFIVSFTSHCGLLVKETSPEVVYFFHFDSGYETSNAAFWNATELQQYKSNSINIDTEHPISIKQLNVLGLR